MKENIDFVNTRKPLIEDLSTLQKNNIHHTES